MCACFMKRSNLMRRVFALRRKASSIRARTSSSRSEGSSAMVTGRPFPGLARRLLVAVFPPEEKIESQRYRDLESGSAAAAAAVPAGSQQR